MPADPVPAELAASAVLPPRLVENRRAGTSRSASHDRGAGADPRCGVPAEQTLRKGRQDRKSAWATTQELERAGKSPRHAHRASRGSRYRGAVTLLRTRPTESRDAASMRFTRAKRRRSRSCHDTVPRRRAAPDHCAGRLRNVYPVFAVGSRPATTSAQDHAMIDLVRDLAQCVTRSPRSIEELIAHLGTAQPASSGAVRRCLGAAAPSWDPHRPRSSTTDEPGAPAGNASSQPKPSRDDADRFSSASSGSGMPTRSAPG